MAAYHWEARRRQLQVERRLQRVLQEREAPGGGPLRPQEAPGEGHAKESPPPHSGSPPKPALQGAAEKCSCTCRTAHAPQHSGKLLKRHSTTEYIQQW